MAVAAQALAVTAIRPRGLLIIDCGRGRRSVLSPPCGPDAVGGADPRASVGDPTTS